MNDIREIPLELIDDNPFQGRQTYEGIETLGKSIAIYGLEEKPKARPVDGRYQIKFGHRRTRSFQWLKDNWQTWGLPDRFNGYTVIPLEIETLTDEEMYCGVVVENKHRQDLSIIEEAKLMVVYRDEFKKSSDEIGTLFGYSGSTARGIMRLLDLPKDIQEKVASGEITQGNARRLLTLQRVAPEQVQDVADRLKGDVDPDIVISSALIESGKAVEMWQSWRKGDPQAGEHLWSLRLPAEKFPKTHLPVVTVTEAAKIVGGDWSSPHDKGVLQNYINWFRDGGWPDGLLEQVNADGKYDRLAHLIDPPSCTACPLYAKVGGSHFCTWKPCFNRKANAWTKNELEQAVQSLGVVQYDHKVDSQFVQLDSYNPKHKKLVDEKHADLRLKKGHTWNSFAGVPHGFMIVAVGKTAEKLSKRDDDGNTSQSRADREAEMRAYRLQQAVREANGNAINEFLWNAATPAFQTLLANMDTVEFLHEFYNQFTNGVPSEEPDKKAKKADRVDFYRRAVIWEMLDRVTPTWDLSGKKHPVAAAAKHLQGVATNWGVKLPKNFLDLAAEADKAIQVVSAETEPA